MTQRERVPEQVKELRSQYTRRLISRQELLAWGAMFGVSLPILHSWIGESEPAHAAGAAIPARVRTGGTLRCSTFQPTQIEPPLLQDVGSPRSCIRFASNWCASIITS